MSKQIEAMKLALKALENTYALRDDVIDAKEALREARAEPSLTAGFVKKIESLIAERDALKAKLAEQPARQKPVKWSDYEPDGMHHNKPAQQPVAFDVVCDDCGGSGNDRKNNNYRCAVCNGLGYSEKMLYTSPQAQPRGESTLAPEPDQQAAAVMTCGAVVSNVYEAYEAGKKAQPQPAREPLTDDQVGLLYKAWQAVGADLRGLKWSDFVEEIGLHEAEHGINAKGGA